MQVTCSERGKVRWIEMQLNSFLMLWPNYAAIFLPSLSFFFFPPLTPASHAPLERIQDGFLMKEPVLIHWFSVVFADLNWIC